MKLEVSKTTSQVTVRMKNSLDSYCVYKKKGEVLTGADVTENVTTFRYESEKRRQEGAVYNVYAGADITTTYGTSLQ